MLVLMIYFFLNTWGSSTDDPLKPLNDFWGFGKCHGHNLIKRKGGSENGVLG